MQCGRPEGTKRKIKVEKNRESDNKGIILAIQSNMVKFIPTLERTLNAKIDRLTADYEQVRAENERLRAENIRLSRKAYGHLAPARPNRQARDTPSSSTSTDPSYLRPTTSSQARTNQQGQSLQENQGRQEDDRSPFYEDGRLVRTIVSPTVPSYMSDTKASVGKLKEFRPNYSRPEEQGESLLEIQSSGEVPSSPTETECSPWKPYYYNPTERFLNDSDPNSLASLTRLNDNSWHGPFDAQLYVPFRVQSRILNSAHRIAQDVMFKAGRLHWPHKLKYHWVGGPRAVMLGRSELIETLGQGIEIDPTLFASPPDNVDNQSFPRRWSVDSVVFAIVNLRNAVCHPRLRNMKAVDSLVSRVQRLAVVLRDFEKAKRVRSLRDELRHEARKVHEDIESIYILRADPMCRKQWKAHHENFFCNVVAPQTYQALQDATQLPLAVRSAAWDWDFARKSREPKPINSARSPWDEEIRLHARLTSRGHRQNSFSGVVSEIWYDWRHIQTLKQAENDWGEKNWSNEQKQMISQLGLIESSASRKKTSSSYGWSAGW